MYDPLQWLHSAKCGRRQGGVKVALWLLAMPRIRRCPFERTRNLSSAFMRATKFGHTLETKRATKSKNVTSGNHVT